MVRSYNLKNVLKFNLYFIFICILSQNIEFCQLWASNFHFIRYQPELYGFNFFLIYKILAALNLYIGTTFNLKIFEVVSFLNFLRLKVNPDCHNFLSFKFWTLVNFQLKKFELWHSLFPTFKFKIMILLNEL